MKVSVLTVAALATLAGAAFAHPVHDHGSHKEKATAAKQAPLICPVSGDKIASVAKAAGKSVYKGKTYYFCCPDCKPRFDKNPEKFVRNAAQGKYEKM